jgi:hypothetical protein
MVTFYTLFTKKLISLHFIGQVRKRIFPRGPTIGGFRRSSYPMALVKVPSPSLIAYNETRGRRRWRRRKGKKRKEKKRKEMKRGEKR